MVSIFSKASIVALLFTTMLVSAPQQEDEMGNINLNDLFNLKLTTGSFLELDLKNTPVSMTIIDRKKIEMSGAKTLGDLCEIYVPSFQYMYNRWNGEIWSMRGVAADFNNKIIFLVNGIKMNLQARNGAFTEMNLGLFNDIERVEVLEGPAGMVYGSGAIAGVVNVVTKKTGEKSGADIQIEGSHRDLSIEGTSMSRIGDDASVTISAGYRADKGLGISKSRLFGYQDWPENTAMSDSWISKGSHGKTPGNFRMGIGMNWGNFELYARATRQQHSTAEMFGRYPWEYHNESWIDTSKITAKYLDTTITTVVDSANNIDSISIVIAEKVYPDSVVTKMKDDAVNHNALYFPDVEINGKTYKYEDFVNDPNGQMSTYKQANQTRRFITDNVALEMKYDVDLNENKLSIKGGAIANQCLSLFENNGFNKEISPWSTSFFWPDLIWSAFGERRYYGSLMFHLNSVERLQSVWGIEDRVDNIGNDFMGRNMQFGSESKHVVNPVVYNSLAFFTENYYSINDMFSILAGFRIDKHTRTASIVSPKLAFVLKPADNQVVKLFAQMSSNNGSAYAYEFNENHYDFSGNVGVTHINNITGSDITDDPNAPIVIVPTEEDLHSLKPERSMSSELIYNITFADDQLSLTPSVSFNAMRDNFIWSSDLQRNINIGDYNAAVGNLSIEYKSSNGVIDAGLHNTIQRPFNTNSDFETKLIGYPTLVKIDSTNSKGDTLYQLDVTGNAGKTSKMIKESITFDGKNFLNIATYTTKMYLGITPVKWLTLYGNMRLFWGLPGRQGVDTTSFNTSSVLAASEKNANYLGIDWNEGKIKSLFAKLNLSAHFRLPKGITVSVYGNNLLGDSYNKNAVRWQNMVSNLKQRKLYTMDTRSYELKISKVF